MSLLSSEALSKKKIFMDDWTRTLQSVCSLQLNPASCCCEISCLPLTLMLHIIIACMTQGRKIVDTCVPPVCVCVCLWFWYTYQNLWFFYGLRKPVSPDYINYWFSIRHSTQMTFVTQYWLFQSCLCEALKIHLWGLLVQFNSAALIFFSYLFLFGMSSKPGLLKNRITYTHTKKQFFNAAFLYTG